MDSHSTLIEIIMTKPGTKTVFQTMMEYPNPQSFETTQTTHAGRGICAPTALSQDTYEQAYAIEFDLPGTKGLRGQIWASSEDQVPVAIKKYLGARRARNVRIELVPEKGIRVLTTRERQRGQPQ